MIHDFILVTNRRSHGRKTNTKKEERRSAIAYETCKLNGIDPFAYLCDVLEKIPTLPHHRLQELLPFHWGKPSVA
ncbi:transposase domain-containing protein [Acidithiobacillus ferridurans]|nr:transposase domain-containing protein [Acidithiobacillus ferridurans]